MNKIKRVFLNLKSDKVIFGSVVMLSGGLIGSFTNYLYHLVIARELGPTEYGILDSLISVLYQLSIPLATITLVITKYVSLFKGQNREKTIESFFWKINKKLIVFIPFILVGFLLITPFVTKFLRLPSPFLFIWIGLAFILGIFSAIGKSFLQGMSRFAELSFTGILDGSSRLIFTFLLLTLGMGLTGAVIPFFIASLIAILFVFFIQKNLIMGERKEQIIEKKEIVKFIFPVLLTNIGATSFITSDIILARHFLNPVDAGLYAALSTLGKIVYFSISPIIGVLFPVISENHAAQKNVNKIIIQGSLMIGVIGFVILFIFSLFPQLMVTVLFGEKFLGMAKYLTYMGIAILLYTINYAFLNVFLALKMTLSSVIICLAAILQIVLIVFLHENIQQIVNVFIFTSALLLCTLLLYYAYVQKKIALNHRPGL